MHSKLTYLKLCLIIILLTCYSSSQAQINLGKLKKKAGKLLKKKTEEVIEEETEETEKAPPEKSAEELNLKYPEWYEKYEIKKFTEEADLVVRVGDIDNLGFGWPLNYDPFSGKETPSHSFPWIPNPKDPSGTDRVMVISSYNGNPPRGRDGYTGRTKSPANDVRPITLEYDMEGIELKTAILQMFVDDFQAPVWQANYQVQLDGERTPYIEPFINELRQTGPIGKMITLNILPEYFHLLKDGKLEIYIDDKTTGAGDGFAIDFVRLLINPKKLENEGVVKGRILDKTTGKPIEGVTVSASDYVQVTTDANGYYTLEGVPAGLVSLKAYKAGYNGEVEIFDLFNGGTNQQDLRLTPREKENSDVMQAELNKSGKAVLYGIYFDVNKYDLKPNSIETLEALLKLLNNNPTKRFQISGHTDSDGSNASNLTLSQNRAEAVVNWLVEKGISRSRVQPKGFGETKPTASNQTPSGKALNRRVEIEVLE